MARSAEEIAQRLRDWVTSEETSEAGEVSWLGQELLAAAAELEQQAKQIRWMRQLLEEKA